MYYVLHVLHVEAGESTSNIDLRFVEGDVEGTQCLGYNWATLSLGDIDIETWPSMLGVGRKACDLAM
jgi:hypothetical protein